MQVRRSPPVNRTSTAAHVSARRLTRTLEVQIEDIMAQVAPRRQPEGVSRGVVTSLFVGIQEYVALCEDQEPPEVGSILEVYLETVTDSVRKFLGTVHNTMGDTVMATWNALYPQPDHAALAVNSAIDMVERVEDVNARLQVRGLPGIAYCIGINTGDALVRPLPGGHRDGDVIGDSVNVARLLSLAGSDCEIIIGEGTRVSIGEQILVQETESLRFQGKQKPVRTFRVTGRVTPL